MSNGDESLADQEILIVHVDIAVHNDDVEEFLRETAANAKGSRAESGVLRFDVNVDLADHAHIVLVEVYRNQAAAAAHKQTPHYALWRDAVAGMMARPRSSVTFTPVATATDWTSGR